MTDSTHQDGDLFLSLMMSLATATLHHLGQAPGSEGTPGIDLKAAQMSIDLLGMLENRTKGNLAPAEERALRDTLHSLRMLYVQVAQAAPATPAAEPETAPAAGAAPEPQSAPAPETDKSQKPPHFRKSYG